MNLFKISWSNIRHKPSNTILSIVLLSFGIGIISLMVLVKDQLSEKFNRNIKDIDFVLAAKGSPLQSILANVYHVDAPTGNMNIDEAQRIIKSPMVKKAIPLAYGDNYQRWRIVGTNADYPNHYVVKVAEGGMFEKPFEVTIGSYVAAETGLKLGSTFTSSHGFDQAAEDDHDAHHHDSPYKVVGIFEESGTVIDNLILTPVESTWLVHSHGDHHEEATHDEGHPDESNATASDTTHTAHTDEHHDEVHADQTTTDTTQAPPLEGLTGAEVMKVMAQGGPNPALLKGRNRGQSSEDEAQHEITAYLILKNNNMAFGMLKAMTENTTMQLADVAIENNRLLNNFGVGMNVIIAIAILISIISFFSIFVSLYNSLKERRYELALMRTMGGTRTKLFTLIVMEGVILVLAGYLIGILMSRAGMLILGNFVKENFHYRITDIAPNMFELILLVVSLAVGVLASLLPALRALEMDISKTLSNG